MTLTGAELCLCDSSRPAPSRELGWRCCLWDAGEQNAGAACSPSVCGTSRSHKALVPALLWGRDGDAGLGAGPPPTCGSAVVPGQAAPAQLPVLKNLSLFKESVQNIKPLCFEG